MSTQALFGQLLIGLINGSFYAMMSLGLAIIFGLLGVTNIAQGAFYMMGAVFSWLMLRELGIGYFYALVLSPILVGLIGAAQPRPTVSSHLSHAITPSVPTTTARNPATGRPPSVR